MTIRLDHRIICELVGSGQNVLDLGCGDGALMSLLARQKEARVQGIELDDEAIHQCVGKGLTVFQGDIESGLVDYPDGSFDVVILNQSMQEVKKVDFVIRETLRVGRRVIVGFPNFAHTRARISLFFLGKTPMTESLPYYWYETPNVRFLSIRDFETYCRSKGMRIVEARFTNNGRIVRFWPNLRARNAIYVLTGP
jgi:methionine biosynthesis protein MetW